MDPIAIILWACAGIWALGIIVLICCVYSALELPWHD